MLANVRDLQQAGSASQTVYPAHAGESPVSPTNSKAQMQSSGHLPAQVEDADDDPVIVPFTKATSFAHIKSESPEPAPNPVDPLAHLRVPIATEGFGFTQEVEGAGPLPELKLNTQEAAEFQRVEQLDLDDRLVENVENAKARMIEALAAGQPPDLPWLKDNG